jgi:hypothetical protein
MTNNYRVVHTFRYYNREFKAGEMTVGLYLMYLRDPVAALDVILTEFNKKKPKLSPQQYRRFLAILFQKENRNITSIVGDILNPKRVENRVSKIKQHIEDIHIRV